MRGGALHHRAVCVKFWIESLPWSVMVRAASRPEDRGVRNLILKTGAPDDRDGHQPAASAHDRRHDGAEFQAKGGRPPKETTAAGRGALLGRSRCRAWLRSSSQRPARI